MIPRAAAGGDRELHVIDLTASPPTTRAVTTGATATLSHGTAEFVAQEEMSRPRGFWWSPDSRSVLYQQTDESAVAVRYIADALHPEAAPTTFFYPRAGTPNATVRLFLLSLRANQATPAPTPIPWDHVAFPYLAHVTWQKYAPPTLLVQNREQTDQRLLAVDAATGAEILPPLPTGDLAKGSVTVDPDGATLAVIAGEPVPIQTAGEVVWVEAGGSQRIARLQA